MPAQVFEVSDPLQVHVVRVLLGAVRIGMPLTELVSKVAAQSTEDLGSLRTAIRDLLDRGLIRTHCLQIQTCGERVEFYYVADDAKIITKK